ncbi:tRNA lysidine(34) synthetase TilS [Microbacterium sp. ZW T5_56]|uniref:tRNA lysidine(34) synthetase TilS n=1 Tax=Microbacterium sp. ZW T5_56 TaxID=3378081 RepID=UPI0038537015
MPSLNPAVAEIRRAVRTALEPHRGTDVIVALSGGADSLALAAAVAFEAPKLDIRARAVTIDHGLQDGSADVAARASAQARALGLDAIVVAVSVDANHPDGPEATARTARYDALERAADEAGAGPILLAHTLDDQAETVLLGLARGSGAASLQGMAHVAGRRLRPLLDIRRETVRAACIAQDLTPWHDPHNADARYTRVRVRTTVLPVLETELGPGIAQALARTAEQLREDNEAFAEMIEETIEDIVEHAEAGIAVSVPALAANPAALRNRIIRHVVSSEFGVSLTRAQTLEVARLVTDWRGQGPLDLPACTASRTGNRLTFTAR